MKYFGWIFLFFIVMFIIPLASRPMVSPFEFADAIPALEMVQSGAYGIVPGNPAEPPMTHWITAASYNLFGINTFSVRLPAALAAGITALLIALLIQQHLRDEKLAALSATIYIAFASVFIYGTIALPVMFSVMAAAGSLGCMFRAVQELKFNRRKFLLSVLSGLFAAILILSAGIYSLIIPVAIMLIYLIIAKKLKELLFITLPFLVFSVLPVIPWGLNLYFMPELLDEFITFKSNCFPWYIYIFVIINGLFPVWILIPASLMTGRESWKRLWNQPLCKFACCAAFFPLIYALALRNIHPSALQITFPAFAILIALGLQAYFNNGGHHRSFDWMINIWAVILLVFGIAEVVLWFLPAFTEPFFAISPLKPVVLLSLGVSSLLGGGALLYSLRGNWRSRLYLFFFSVAILPLGFSWGIKNNVYMPETEFRMFITQLDIIPEKSLFFAEEEDIPALQWCTGEKINSVDCGCDLLNMIESTGKNSYLIVKKDSPLLEKFQIKSENITSGSDFVCVKFLPGDGK